MKIRTFFFTAVALLFLDFTAGGQNIFVLEKVSSGRNMKFTNRDQIKVETAGNGMKFQGIITQVTDSSLVLNYGTEIMVRDIAKVYTSRWGFRLLQGVFLTAGILYVSLNTINGLVNGDDPVVPRETLAISGGLIAGGLLMIPLSTRIHDVEHEKWKIKILDFTD